MGWEFTLYNITQRFRPARVFAGCGIGPAYEMVLAPFQPEEVEKVREILLGEYRCTNVVIVGNRRVDFSLSPRLAQT
jgi:hypothetical protein